MKLSRALKKSESEVAVIGDIKRRSPEIGDLMNDRNPIDIAESMVDGGIDAVSVVTESEYFKGSLGLLEKIGNAIEVPILVKDFFREEEEVKKAKQAGADSILLISSILDENSLKDLYEFCKEIEVEPLVETHTRSEIELANDLGVGLVGINNRNIKKLEKDSGTVQRTEKLVNYIHGGALVISESSIRSPEDIDLIKKKVEGVLVGTAILKSKDPEGKVKELKSHV